MSDNTDEIIAQHATAFRNLWLPVVDPRVDTALPLDYLRTLYPHIWAYGPRGDIYINQLRAIAKHLDTDPAYVLLEDASRFLTSFQIENYLSLPGITAAVTRERRLHHPYPFLDYNLDDYPYQQAVIAHPVILAYKTDGKFAPPIRNVVRALTFHSLNRDLIQVHENYPLLDERYASYCNRWDIPV